MISQDRVDTYMNSQCPVKNLAPGFMAEAPGLLEPFFAGWAQKFSTNQRSGQLVLAWMSTAFARATWVTYDYETTVGHVSLYYDAGGMFDIEVNAGHTSPVTGGQQFRVSLVADGGWRIRDAHRCALRYRRDPLTRRFTSVSLLIGLLRHLIVQRDV